MSSLEKAITGGALNKAISNVMKAQARYSNGTQRPDTPRQGLPGGSKAPNAPYHFDSTAAKHPGRPDFNGQTSHAPDFNLKPGSRQLASITRQRNTSAIDPAQQEAYYDHLIAQMEEEGGDPFITAELRRIRAFWTDQRLRGF